MFRQKFSDIPVVVNTGGSDIVAKWMATGFWDIGFCSIHTDVPSLRYELETPYATTICTMVSKGLGVSIVNPVVARALQVAGLREIPFSEKIDFHSYAVTSDHFPVNSLARRMAECVHATFATLGARRSRL